MSYVVFIWQSPVPTSATHADAIHGELSGQSTAQNPLFIELASRLTKRYPSPVDSGDDEDECVWTDGPMDGKTDCAVYGIGVVTDYLGEVVPFVAREANALGLVMYDMQTGDAHLPDGTVLTVDGAVPRKFSAAVPAASEPQSKRAVGEILRDHLLPVLKPSGFKLGWSEGQPQWKKLFKEHQYLGSQNVYFSLRGYPGKFRIQLGATFLSMDFSKLMGPEFKPYPHGMSKHGVSFASAGRVLNAMLPDNARKVRVDGEIEVRTAAETEAVARDCAAVVSKIVLPAFKSCEELAGFDACLNPADGSESIFDFDNLGILVGYLAGNPRLPQLVAARARAIEAELERCQAAATADNPNVTRLQEDNAELVARCFAFHDENVKALERCRLLFLPHVG
jgi:hypothetical protein